MVAAFTRKYGSNSVKKVSSNNIRMIYRFRYLMSKRESPVGLILILLATFGLSVAGIWLAYQFGFGSHSDVEYTYEYDRKRTFTADVSEKLEPVIKKTPKPNSTPTKLKTADDIFENPVQTQIKFLFDSNQITSEGVEKLNQLKKEIAEFDSQTVAVRIYSNIGESEFSQQIGRERGEEVAGYLRHLGLKNNIVISKRSANLGNNFSSQQKRNQPLIVELYKL